MTTTRKIKDIPKIDNIYHPSSVEDIQLLIQHAKKQKLTVRTVGSGHAPAPAIYAETDKQICMNLDGELRKIKKLEIDSSKEFATVTVGAGCYIGVNPKDSSSTDANSLVKQLTDKGFALQSLGGISHQSIGGFLTGSSGGTTYSLHDSIMSITFIDGHGNIRTAEKGTDLFNFIGNSMGLGGVIIDVTIKCPTRYSVQGTEVNRLTSDKSSCFAPDEAGNFPDLDNALFGDRSEYAHFDLYPYCGTVTKWEAKRIPFDDKNITPYQHVLAKPAMAKAAEAALKATDEMIRSDNDNIEALANLQKIFVPLSIEQNFSDVWYEALPIDDQVYELDSTMDMEFSELWFPREQLIEVMRRFNKLLKENPKAAGNLPTEFYASPASPFWLAPSHGYTQGAFRVDLYWFKQNENKHGEREAFFGRFWEALHDVPGLRFHWGKHMPKPGTTYGQYTFQTEHLSKNYEKWDAFLKLRSQLDPDDLFVTDYWRNHLGIQPKLTAQLNNAEQPKEPARSWANTIAGAFGAVAYSAAATLGSGLGFYGRNNPASPAAKATQANAVQTKPEESHGYKK